jgi:DNA-3-methyladenine glycosylase
MSARGKMAETKKQLRIRRLRRAELPTDTVELARYLIGKTLVIEPSGGGKGSSARTLRRNARGSKRVRLSGRIIETEAYPIGDPAGHAFRGLTPGNRSLFLDRGRAYVYFTYGSSFMFNVSAEHAGVGGGVLVRALEPVEGIAYMERRRGTREPRDLTRGPGRLAAALAIDKRYDGVDLCAPGTIWLGAEMRPAGEIGMSVRIGINRAVRRPWRFFERGNPHVSGPKWLNE